MNNSIPKFEIGDFVKFSDTVTQEDFNNTSISPSHKDDVFQVYEIDLEPWETFQCGGVVTACGRYIPDVLLVKVTSPQQKLDQLKKYFESGNNVPVQQATIKAKDFWAIYNS